MDRKLLTALGCSGSIALTLLSTSPAKANSTSEYVFNSPTTESDVVAIPASETDYPWSDCTCSEYDPAMIEKIDKQGDKAIDLYGCDCAGCRRLVRNIEDSFSVN